MINDQAHLAEAEQLLRTIDADTVEASPTAIAYYARLVMMEYDRRWRAFEQAREVVQVGQRVEHAQLQRIERLEAELAVAREASEPVHEVECPQCGATIRARMADSP